MVVVLPTGRLGGLHQVPQGARHILDSVDQHDLGLLVLGAETGGSVLHHVGEGHDGGDGVLGGDCQLLLGGGSAGNQSLGVLHQSLGGLEDVFSVICDSKTLLERVTVSFVEAGQVILVIKG